MTKTEVREWSIEIACAPERLFDLLADLRAYEQWLPRSSAFHGTMDITPGAVAAGTRYVEPGPFGTRHGAVTRFERSVTLDFEQPMTMKPPALGRIGIRVFHRIDATPDGARLTRRLELTPSGPIRFVWPLIARAFVAENERMMPLIKAAAEARAT